jgi:membrane protease YdiL (CAAX protease family)
MAQRTNKLEKMNPSNDNPKRMPADLGTDLRASSTGPASPTMESPVLAVSGDPLSFAGEAATAAAKPDYYPDDLRISWSWPHLLIFLFFGVASQIAIGIAVLGYYSAVRHLTQKQLQKLVVSDPTFIVGTTLFWFALIILFLYMTLAVLRELPFWKTLGWKKLNPDPSSGKGKPWMYFVSGCGLAIFVAVASSRVKDAEHTPIQELFKNRTGAMLLMGMAVFVAPMVEETLFRGYLYPVLARMFSSLAQVFGVEISAAIRAGMATSIFVTGVLFGLLHAPQLGWTWGLVSLLILVGVIFTFARAWTGTVLASFLLHLGYNSMIAVTSIIATKGFTHMPPGQ